eukprot:6200939-Pleurochrysis_carterae.AAC.1
MSTPFRTNAQSCTCTSAHPRTHTAAPARVSSLHIHGFETDCASFSACNPSSLPDTHARG